jgi:hypothetical protein
MTAILETKDMIHDLSPPDPHKSNGFFEHMNRTIVMMVRSITLDYADMIPQALWAEAYSTAIHIKNPLPPTALNSNNHHTK